MRTTGRLHAIPSVWPGPATQRSFPVVYVLTLLVAISIATWAYVVGNQPVILDAAGYYEYARVIRAGGLGAFASDLRTYGYPAFLAAIMVVVGEDVVDVQAGVFVVQLALFIGACFVGARRLEGALGIAGIGRWVFLATAVNPFLLFNSVQLLTDLPAAVLIYLAVALSLPRRHPDGAARVLALAACALLCAGLAAMMRPASLIVAPVVGGIWIARARLFRDVPWRVVPVALLAFALPFAPQIWSNQRVYGVPHPLIVGSMYTDMMQVGFEYAKTGSMAMPGVPNALRYDNPFRPPPGLTIRQVIFDHPGLFLATVAVHTFALLDQDFPFTYIRAVDPWYRWPLWALSNLFYLSAMAGFVVGLRGTATTPPDTLRRRRFALLALAAAGLAVIAVYVPTEIQGRYALPLYPLLAAPFAIGVTWIGATVPTAGLWRVSLGSAIVAAWLGGGAVLSIWLQAQAPILVAVRDGTIGPNAVVRRDARPAAPAKTAAPPTPPPGLTAPPAREIPLATYQADLPRELVAGRSTEFDVTVTNAGREAWNVRGEYPVNVAARFVARTTELHQRVVGLMRDSQSVELPRDVAPGETATVRLRIMAPPEPGRYTLLVHVTRLGVPDSSTTTDRVVRVVDGR